LTTESDKKRDKNVNCIAARINWPVWRTLVLLGCCLGLPSVASAGFVISFQNTAIQQGGTGAMNVYIHSDTGRDPLLYAFGLAIRIMSNQSTVLEFLAIQSHGELSAPKASNYVFYPSGSENLANPGSASGVVSPSLTDYVTLDTSKSMMGGDPVSMTPSLTLLAVLDLTSLTAAPANIGDTFNVELLTSSTDTFFVDENFDDIAFSTNSGTVTIGGATPVPEPSSLVLAVCAIGIFAGFRRRMHCAISHHSGAA